MIDTVKVKVSMGRSIKWAILVCLMGFGSAHAAAPMTFVMQSFPPFVVDEKGIPEGPFPEMVWAVCASMKIQCKQEIYPWRRALRLAEDGEVDGILVIQKLPEREQAFYMTEPIVRSSYVVFAHQNAKLKYAVPADLAGYTVGVYGPSATSQTAEEIAQSTPSMKMVLEVDNTTVLRKLSALRYGEQAVAVMNLEVGNYLIKQEKISGLKVAGEIKRFEYFIGLSRKKLSAKQAGQFNSALHELMRNGTIKAIAEKHGMKAAFSQNPEK